MKKIIFAFCFLCTTINAQTSYKYYLNLSSFNNAHTFARINGKLVYNGSNPTDSAFFSNYTITEYSQAFPEGIDPAVLNIFYLETTSGKLASDLKSKYPSIYLNSEDITNRKIEFLDTYPNDYGTTSPLPNSGAPVSRAELDFLNVPKAWDITTGNSNIKIGISDTPLRLTAPDFLNKVTTVAGYTPNTTGVSHGISVAALAAARGNNASGSVGVCMDCNIVAGYMGIGAPTMFSNLYKIAQLGAKVINMSWCSPCYTNNANGGSPNEQLVINDLVNNYNVTLVAAAGNLPSFSTPQSFYSTVDAQGNLTGIPQSPFGEMFVYPASYDNVISVSSINHANKYTLPLSTSHPSYCCTSPWFPIYVNLEDSVGHSCSGLDPMNPVGVLRNGYYINQYNPDGFQTGHTLNSKVDILSTGYNIFSYTHYLDGVPPLMTGGTSFSAPMVAGTVGLMLSVNECLKPKEIESALQLSSKDIENMPINQNYVGYVGAGRLESNEAVTLVNEMKKINGNAVIDNHIFNRFNFKLDKINNNLKIENVTFKDYCVADFTAKNQIQVKGNSATVFKPNASGLVVLKIDPTISISCTPVVFPKNTADTGNDIIDAYAIALYPNPNNGNFEISIKDLPDFQNNSLDINVFDLNGRLIYQNTINTTSESLTTIPLSLTDISHGVYFIKITSANGREETLKFVKSK